MAFVTAADFSLAVLGAGTLLALVVAVVVAAGRDGPLAGEDLAEFAFKAGGCAAGLAAADLAADGLADDFELTTLTDLDFETDRVGGWRLLLDPFLAEFAFDGIFFWAIGSSHSVRTEARPERPHRKSTTPKG